MNHKLYLNCSIYEKVTVTIISYVRNYKLRTVTIYFYHSKELYNCSSLLHHDHIVESLRALKVVTAYHHSYCAIVRIAKIIYLAYIILTDSAAPLVPQVPENMLAELKSCKPEYNP